jgi:hypothetical protein
VFFESARDIDKGVSMDTILSRLLSEPWWFWLLVGIFSASVIGYGDRLQSDVKAKNAKEFVVHERMLVTYLVFFLDMFIGWLIADQLGIWWGVGSGVLVACLAAILLEPKLWIGREKRLEESFLKGESHSPFVDDQW